jgi:hypothetical protein
LSGRLDSSHLSGIFTPGVLDIALLCLRATVREAAAKSASDSNRPSCARE